MHFYSGATSKQKYLKNKAFFLQEQHQSKNIWKTKHFFLATPDNYKKIKINIIWIKADSCKIKKKSSVNKLSVNLSQLD